MEEAWRSGLSGGMVLGEFSQGGKMKGRRERCVKGGYRDQGGRSVGKRR